MTATLIHGDCLDVMATLDAGSVDLILADLPYGTTACKWDTVIPFALLWESYRRLLKPRGAVVLTASQPFTSALVMSNPDWFKYCWVWEKTRPGDVFNAKNKPLKVHEDICVFSPGTTANCSPRRMTYNPVGVKSGGVPASNPRRPSSFMSPRPSHLATHVTLGTGYPTSIVRISNPNHKSVHPTQKPVELMEYLVRTYTDPEMVVLDNCMGSGTTGIACANLGREFIGVEREAEYFGRAETRIRAAEQANAELLFA